MAPAEAKKTYLVGIEFDSPYEDGGYFDFKLRATMEELARAVLDIFKQGHSFPTFPPSANPTVLFASELETQENGDCYQELMTAIRKLSSKKE